MLKQFLICISCSVLFSCTSLNSLFSPSLKTYKDPRDGERYGYVQIGNDIWMTENMRYDIDGSKLNPNNPSPLYGRLYNWEQAMEVCPKGWNLSTDLDWMAIERYCVPKDSIIIQKTYRGQNVKILKSKKDWNSKGTDSLKLNILPAGRADYNGFHSISNVALFWTADSHIKGGVMGEKFAYYRVIKNSDPGIYYSIQSKESYLSCRCVKYLFEDGK